MKSSLSLTIACCLLASCTPTYQIEGAHGALAKRGTAKVVVKESDSGDAVTRRAVERELRSRGFKVADSGKADLTVNMGDTWRWDVVMYLLDLDLVFLDSKTGSLQAQAHYRNSAAHSFPNTENVVGTMFAKMDEKGIFEK